MKHTLTVTSIVLAVFFLTQIIGLFIVNSYIDKAQLEKGMIVFKELPLNVERPQVDESVSFIYVVLAILVGTVLALILIRFRQVMLWKLWFLSAIFITLDVAFGSFLPGIVAGILAIIFALWKIFRPNIFVQNITELFMYGGLAAIFVPVFNLFSIIMILILISIYDMYAVWKSKHMIELAKFQTKSKMFAGVMIPYSLPKKIPKNVPVKKVKMKIAILGGGDIGFPLLFAGVLFKGLLLTNTVAMAFAKVIVVPVFATAALGTLLYYAQKDKFYPAMPTISAGCFAGLLVMKLAGFL